MEDSIFAGSDVMLKRSWDVTASAASSTSTAVATKAAVDGKQFVVTGVSGGFAGASAATPLVLSISKGATVARQYVLPVGTTLALEFLEGQYLVGNINEAVSATIAASSTSGAVGYVTLHGFHVGVK